MDLQNYYTKKKVKSLGFSDRLIAALLPEPLLVTNPHHEKAMPMKLWERKEVKRAMLKDEFIAYQKERQHRSFSMKNNAEEKRLETKQLMIGALKDLNIKVVSYKELVSRTRNYVWFRTKKRFDDFDYKEQKIRMLSTIRHQLTNYDQIYRNLFGKYGCIDGFVYMREELLKQIARYYPFLEETVCHEIMELRNSDLEKRHVKYLKQRRKKIEKKKRQANALNA